MCRKKVYMYSMYAHYDNNTEQVSFLFPVLCSNCLNCKTGNSDKVTGCL